MDQEQQWIRQIQLKSSRTAAQQLVSRYYEEIYAYVYRQTLDKEVSLDLTQEIFISLLQTIRNYETGKSSFKTWLYKIATNHIVDYFRSKYYKYGHVVVPLEEGLLHAHADFTVQIEQKQEIEKMLEIVNQSDMVSQQIFRLKLFAGYTFKEIAELLQIPEPTAKTKYYALIKKIKASLKGDESWTSNRSNN
ncbi:MAG: sigma-70 family RNA polymerase sigma factor [Bacillota bacterium]|nr:RNA polymerase subunit sigma-70 [Bacillota bacterium]